jgi:aspartyl-tRNA(Asn)/glutamyl-tRNA(Gln) amidotransferase subunit A
MPDELFFTPAHHLREKLLKKELSCVELIHLFLARAKKLNKDYPAWVEIREEQAIKEALLVDRKIASGHTEQSLLGVPIAVSDNLDLEGSATRRGSSLVSKQILENDCREVACLRKEGAIVIGKTSVSEFYLNPYMENSLGINDRHYLDPNLSAGGPEGGMATAIALGQVPLGLAASSMKLPAGLSGISSFKVTRGLIKIQRGFTIPTACHNTYTPSPAARDLKDLTQCIDTLIKKGDPRNPSEKCYLDCLKNLCSKELQISWTADFGFVSVDSTHAQHAQKPLLFLEEKGFKVNELKLNLDPDTLMHFSHVWSVDHYIPIVSLFENDPEKCKQVTPSTKAWLNLGKKTSGIAYAIGMLHIKEMHNLFKEIFKKTDVLIAPTAPCTKIPKGKLPHHFLDPLCGLWGLTIPTGMAGFPSLNITAGYTEEGFPVGIQIIVNRYNERLLLQLGRYLEENFHPLLNKPLLKI